LNDHHPCIQYNNYYMNRISLGLLILLVVSCWAGTPEEDLAGAIQALKSERQLKGMQVQVTKGQSVVFNLNLGEKNEANEPIDNSTLFRIASVSKSFSSVAILQLIEQKKLSLNQSLSSIFGFTIENPFFPGQPITVEMILSHQSSLMECEPYYSNFLDATYNAKTGTEVPNIKEILLRGGRFYNDCVFSSTHRPGSYFHYVNLNFGIAGTIVEIISGKRFDEYQRDNILTFLSEGLPETATFNAANIKDPKNLGVLYNGNQGKWEPAYDYYPSGQIIQRNLTGYQIGSNGVIYGPQGGLRASASHLSNYAIMLANGGKTKTGRTILSADSVKEMVKPRYHYHGVSGGVTNYFHIYSLGLFTTTYRKTDTIISHEVVHGHTGSAYNLVSAQHFWKDYTLTYIINGALNGYK
jgi:CubicO group peptidase (beta-lactamase class C family)